MARRWCASFARAREKRDVERFARSFLASAIVAAILIVPFRASAEASRPAPVPDAAFLSLPTVDLEQAPAGSSAQVGDVLTLKVSGPLPSGSVVDTSAIASSIVDQGWEVHAGGVGSVSVIPLQGGHLTLPSLPVKDPSGKLIARTNPFSLDVASAIRPDDKDPGRPADLAPPVGLGFPWIVLALIAFFVILALAGLGYVAFLWIKKVQARKNQPLPEPVKSADEIALAALERLRAEGLAEKGQFKRHYFGVSEVFKAYLGARYGFDARESTSFELVSVMEERKWVSPAMLDRIEALFSRMDRVKFTDHVPETEEALGIVDEVRKIVRETRKIPDVVPERRVPAEKGAR